MARRIFVTGGSGFIGSNFIHYMLDKYPNYSVVNFDKLTYAGNQDNLIDVADSPNYDFIHGDICNLNEVAHAMEGCDAVVNFAAESHVDRSIVSSAEFVKTNVLGTQTLLDVAKHYSVSRFLHISTDEVYGSIEKGSFTEKDALRPNSPYSASKAGADLLCRAYHKTHNMPILITRSSNNFGPYQFPEKLIPVLIERARQDLSLPIYGDGLNVRDWIYVEDNCAGIDAVLHKGIVGQVYNLGAGNEVANIDITKMILDILGKPHSLISFVEDRPGHDRRYSISTEKVAKLGWQPLGEFAAALERTVKWYLDNDEWLNKLRARIAGE